MVWSRKIEDVIYHLFYKYDIHGNEDAQKKLKNICINVLNFNPDIKSELKTDKDIEFFVIQIALENF